MPDSALYIGLMSGTSLDGVDGVIARFDSTGKPALAGRASDPFPEALRLELLALNSPGDNELARAALASNALAAVYANVVNRLLGAAGLTPRDITAIGAHGQTVRHQPALGYTIQLNAPALLVELTDIAVVADFRTRDVAAGGQGAPLVPTFHAGVFGCDHTRVVLNLGGIANITVLRPGEPPLGFDTGPANALMDMWCHEHTGMAYDANGDWGAQGIILPDLLDHLIASEPWFALPAPKSTGRDLFNRAWLDDRISRVMLDRSTADTPGFRNTADNAIGMSAVNIQATLRALTARSACDAILQAAPDVSELVVCGGGARNSALMRELASRLPCAVKATDEIGIAAQDVEALAFAWLAWAHHNKKPAGLPAVTGARGPRLLGATWPR